MRINIFRHRIPVSLFRNSSERPSARRALYLGAGTFALASALGLGLAGVGFAPAASQQVAGTTQPTAHYREVVDTYCIGCHNGQLKTAGLELDNVDVANPSADAEVFEKVIRKLRARAMPPQGLARPDEATYKDIVNYLETSLDRAAAAKLNPGRPAVHRVNRTEYANAIRDLLAVDTTAIDLTAVLPTDDAGYGFDNIADVLTVSPLLIEGYLSAARRVSRMAIGDRAAGPVTETYDLPRFLIQNDRMGENLPLGSRGGMAVRHHFPLDAEYTVRIKLQKNGYEYTIGTEHARQFDVRVDGERVSQFKVGGDYKGVRPAMPSSNLGKQGDFERYLNNADQNLEARFKVKAGTRLVQVTFPKRTREPEGVYRPPATDYSYVLLQARPDEEPAIASVTIGGPYNASGMSDMPSRAKIFVCTPKSAAEEEPCAQQILGKLARQAYRRPTNDADLKVLMDFYQQGRQGGTFDDGIQVAVQRILVDPEFLFRTEQDPPDAAPGTAYRLSDLELASRLSFFLWSSIPDDELLTLAEQKKLSDPNVLEQQTRRMLADPRSSAMVKNFSGQWLYLRNVEQAHPNPDFFPDFDANLRQAFLKETELFFESQVREDRSVPELLSAKYSYLNERLARHYGIPNVYGSEFRRVELSDPNRQGALSQGSILTVTSFPTRTSPTIRGKWLLENILGTPPPPPPPNVPSLDDTKTNNGKPMTVREALEAHRVNPACAVCHKVMDPLGFALENFDATGKWRTTDGGNPIDTSGVAPDGFPLSGPSDLRKYLDSHADQFVNTVASKLMTYALGRGVEYYDAPALRKVMKDAETNNYRWSSLVLGIVKSTPFQMRNSRVMMIITQKAIHRRTVLKGVGATLALPFLDAMVPAFAQAPALAKAPNRLSVVYLPNGIMMNDWTPEKEGADYTFKRILEPLAPFKDKTLIISGLTLDPARAQQGENGGDHARGGTAYLTGVHPKKTEGADTEAAITMDQIAARELGKHTQFASLEMCVDTPELLGQCEAGYTCAYMNTISWRTPKTPMPMENRPRQVFERLFGDSESTDPAVRLRRIKQDKSILDSVTEKAGQLRVKVGAADSAKIDEYLEAVRDVERRVQTAEAQSGRELPKVERPVGIPDTFTDHAKLMFDLQVLALQTDLTRVLTFMMGREFTFRTFAEIGIPDGYHTLTHHQYRPDRMEKVTAIQTYHARHFAYYLDKLSKTKDGDGSLLDHMTVLYGGGISDGNSHLHDNLPTVLVGGASGQWKGGRHVRYPKDTPLSNLLLTMLDTVGVHDKTLGDSTGRLDLHKV